MDAPARALLVLIAASLPLAISAQPPAGEAPVTPAELAGAWTGTLAHAGETTSCSLELEPGDDARVLVKLSIPVIHVAHSPLGRVYAFRE